MSTKRTDRMYKCFYIYIFLLCLSCQQEQNLPDPLEAGWKGDKVCEILKETDRLRTLKCTFPPNVGHEKHFHDEHFGYTLQGSRFRITDQTGTREVDVPSGYYFYNKSVEWHEVFNIGDSTAVYLIIEPKQ
jgi:quercetin dioxygenase-like cupin family protein